MKLRTIRRRTNAKSLYIPFQMCPRCYFCTQRGHKNCAKCGHEYRTEQRS